MIPACIDLPGSRGTLVFLHGIGGAKEYWADDLGHFAAAGWRCIAWDAPGYGDSNALPAFTWAALSEALETLLAARDVTRPILIGQSMGGMVALDFAARRLRPLAGLSLMGTSPAFGRTDGDWQKQFVTDRLAPLDRGCTMTDFAATLIGGMCGPCTPDPIRRHAAAIMARVPPATYRAALAAVVAFDRREALADIVVPALLVAGEADPNAPPATMERMAARLPKATYAVLPAAGHLMNLEAPVAFRAALTSFLSSLE